MHTNQPVFVPFDSPFVSPVTDLSEDRESAAIAFYLADRFWQIDPARVVCSGYVADDAPARGRSLQVTLRDGDETYESVEIDAPFSGGLVVQPKDGRIADAIGRDLIRATKDLWLAANGYPQGFPAGVACEVHGNSVEIRIDPLA